MFKNILTNTRCTKLLMVLYASTLQLSPCQHAGHAFSLNQLSPHQFTNHAILHKVWLSASITYVTPANFYWVILL